MRDSQCSSVVHLMPRLRASSRERFSFDLRDEPVPWNVGEHVAVIGRTGTGKTYLMTRLVDLRQYVAVFKTKADDTKFEGMEKVKDAKPLRSLYRNRLFIEPPFNKQSVVGADLFDSVWRAGGWTVVIDELFYVHDQLGLKSYVEMLLTQGRSKRISILAGMQRPVHVTRFALSEVSHVFSFKVEKRDRKTLAEVASDEFAEVVERLPRYHFAHYHVPTGTVAMGTADRLDRVLTGARSRALTRT